MTPTDEPRGTEATFRELRSWQQRLRAQFPILADPDQAAYLDNAATSQKPQAVLDATTAYLSTTNANAGRGSYTWANRTTELVERTRDRIKNMLDDPSPESSHVLLTSGATEALRTVARDWLPLHLRDGDEIVVPFADHQANILPWQETQDLLARQGVRVRLRPMPYQLSSGDYDHRALAAAVGPRTRFVAVTHVHHVYGADMNIHRIRQAVGPDAVICLDASQSIGHQPVSVTDLDVDFVAFSGHKALALPGTGALWSRQVRGPRFRPQGWSGTPNTAGAVSLLAALDWLHDAGIDRIERWTTALALRLTDALSRLDAFHVLGCQLSLDTASATQRRQSIVTFRHRSLTSSDLGFVLFSHGFMVRSDNHCQGSAGEKTGSVRVSTHVYNTPEEIDRLVGVLASLG
ncbi:aminotransferase class V-fold PLP-dependent enzyme [Streptomyces polygonati]|uniref:Aminotransferase class V-fold PLP-dependent enzyme n=1 Tax=Streptomyces polygonati TaxID=1617087 RepID=A0ABV8HRM5_9ACTN